MIKQELNISQINHQLHGPSGAVTRDLLRRGLRVQAMARRLVRVNDGVLRNQINIGTRPFGTSIAVIVGTNVKYGMWVHRGTGIYGPHATPIVPVRAARLRFTTRSGRVVFTKSVRGQTSNPYLRNALIAVKG